MKKQAHPRFTSGKYQILCKTDFYDIPPARGGNSDGLHVTQVAADESDRHSANSGLDGMQKRNGCVPQTDMPRTDAASAEVSSASAYQPQVSCGSTEGRADDGQARLSCRAIGTVSRGTAEIDRTGKGVTLAAGLGRNANSPMPNLPEEAQTSQVGTQAPPAGIHFVKRFSSSSGLKSRNPKNSLNFFSNSGVCWRSAFLGRIATYWAELMRRTLAPLRKIVARELEVFEFGRNSVHPQSFAVHDRLECGHVHTSLLWDIFDLLNGYTESPHVRAIRHRCQECLTLTQRKPMASVAAVAKAA